MSKETSCFSDPSAELLEEPAIVNTLPDTRGSWPNVPPLLETLAYALSLPEAEDSTVTTQTGIPVIHPKWINTPIVKQKTIHPSWFSSGKKEEVSDKENEASEDSNSDQKPHNQTENKTGSFEFPTMQLSDGSAIIGNHSSVPDWSEPVDLTVYKPKRVSSAHHLPVEPGKPKAYTIQNGKRIRVADRKDRDSEEQNELLPFVPGSLRLLKRRREKQAARQEIEALKSGD